MARFTSRKLLDLWVLVLSLTAIMFDPTLLHCSADSGFDSTWRTGRATHYGALTAQRTRTTTLGETLLSPGPLDP